MRFKFLIPVFEKCVMPPSLPLAKGEPEIGKHQISRSCAVSWQVLTPHLDNTGPAWAVSIEQLHNWPLEGAVDPRREGGWTGAGEGGLRKRVLGWSVIRGVI